jgi:phenylacetic acid degradation operon negative regulatory protein
MQRARPTAKEPANAADGLKLEAMQPQELVMTLLGSYVRPFHETVWSGGFVVLLTEMGFSKGSARAALTRLARRNLISRVRTGRLIHYRITDRADHLLAEGDRRIFSLGARTDGANCWTMLWHDIPETQRLERGRLARRLRFLGFGSLQDSLWISPHDRAAEVDPILAELGIAELIGILVGDLIGQQSPQAVVSRAWDVERLDRRYREFADRYKRYGRRNAAKLDDKEAFLVRTELVHLYRSFPFLDPDLPDELLGDPSARQAAAEAFSTAYARLEAGARRHFDLVTTAYDQPAASGR